MSKYKVPLSEQKEFDLLVQRANRRIKRSLEYIQKEDIKSESAQRALVSDYTAQSSWSTPKTVFSRSKVFDSERDYKAYVRHIMQWGAPEAYERSVASIRKGYEDNIIKALTTVAIDNGQGVLTKQGRLPGNLAKKIRELSLEQLTNFFEHADPTEIIEAERFNSYDYMGVDRQEFVDITVARLNSLKEIYPDNRPKQLPKKRKSSKSRKGKSKKGKSKKK